MHVQNGTWLMAKLRQVMVKILTLYTIIYIGEISYSLKSTVLLRALQFLPTLPLLGKGMPPTKWQ